MEFETVDASRYATWHRCQWN